MSSSTPDPTPGSTEPATGEPPVKKKIGKGKIAGIAGGGCCALILILFIIGLIGAGLSGELGADPETPAATTATADPVEEPTTEPTTEAPAEEPSATTEAEPSDEPTTAEPTTEAPATTEAAPSGQEWADSIADYVLTANGAEQWSDLCGTGWCSYVTNVHATAEGTLYVDLQIEPGAPDNEQLARNTASFIILSAAGDHPELDWVVVNDGTGTIIEQYQPSDFGQ